LPSGLEELTGNALVVYPNPAKDALTISYNTPGEERIHVELYNVYGQKINNFIEKNSIGLFSITIDISYLESGVYVIRLKGDRSVQKKFVKL
jgi:hypothetical protein